MTLPSEIITRAVTILQSGGAQVVAQAPPVGPPGQAIKGWCQSGHDGTWMLQAKDHDRASVRLFKGAADKATFNPDAVQFTAYAALVKVLGDADVQPEQLSLMWNTLWDMALAEPSVVHLGGIGNYANPLIAFNEAPGRLPDEVVNFMKGVAAYLKTVEGAPAPVAQGVGPVVRDYATVPPKRAKPPAKPVAKPRAKRSKVVRNSPKGRKR